MTSQKQSSGPLSAVKSQQRHLAINDDLSGPYRSCCLVFFKFSPAKSDGMQFILSFRYASSETGFVTPAMQLPNNPVQVLRIARNETCTWYTGAVHCVSHCTVYRHCHLKQRRVWASLRIGWNKIKVEVAVHFYCIYCIRNSESALRASLQTVGDAIWVSVCVWVCVCVRACVYVCGVKLPMKLSDAGLKSH